MCSDLMQFQTDYIISWDFKEGDISCVKVSRLRKDGSRLMADVVGVSYLNSGCVSLFQAFGDYDYRERCEKERQEKLRENRENLFKLSDADKEKNDD